MINNTLMFSMLLTLGVVWITTENTLLIGIPILVGLAVGLLIDAFLSYKNSKQDNLKMTRRRADRYHDRAAS